MRTVITPPVPAPAALAELKQWLGITTAHDDAPLAALLAAALEICEGFTGVTPLACEYEEMLPARGGRALGGWQAIATRPLLAITGVASVALDGTRAALPPEAYAMEIEADGTGRVRLMTTGSGRIAVRFTAGLAETWGELPDALRQGVLRLAAHQHREREASGAAPLPPASVAALWRPFRRMRLA